MHRTKLLSAIAAAALLVGLAGCGGSSDSADKATTTEAKASSDGKITTTESESSTTEADDAASTTVVATGGGKFCKQLAGYINEMSTSDIDVSDKEGYKQFIEDSAEQSKELLSSAPDELQDSVDVLVEVQEKLASELEKVDYDFMKLPDDAMSSMNTPEFTKANEELTAYVKDTCGIDLEAPQVDAPELTTPSGN
jgi:hypothetical protein